MQIVIDIDEDLYDTIKNLEVFITTQRSGKRIINGSINAIKNGIQLPKGHGDLKDIAEIERLWQKGDYDSLASALIFAPIVIEADKAESEKV